MLEYTIQDHEVIRNQFEVNQNNEQVNENLELDISGEIAVPTYDNNSNDIQVNIILTLGNDETRFKFLIETVTVISLLNQVSDIEQNCSDIAIQKTIETSNQILKIYNFNDITIPLPETASEIFES